MKYPPPLLMAPIDDFLEVSEFEPSYHRTKIGPGTPLAWPGWKQPDIPMEAKPAKVLLTKVCLASELTIGWCTQPANSQLILQSSMKHLRLAGLA